MSFADWVGRLGVDLSQADALPSRADRPTPREPDMVNLAAERILKALNLKVRYGGVHDRDAALWGLYQDLRKAGVTDPDEMAWYAVRCDAAKHDDAWICEDVRRFFAKTTPATEAKPDKPVGAFIPSGKFQATDLSAWCDNPPPKPEARGFTGMLVPGRLSWWYGEPESGKSWLATKEVVWHLKAGDTVMVFDEEGAPDEYFEHLQLLGATREDIARLRYFNGLGLDLTKNAEELAAMVDQDRPALVVLDSSAAFLSLAGLNEDKAEDVTGFIMRVLLPIAHQQGAAVLVIDHVQKAANGVLLYPRGSGAKRAKSDRMCQVTMPDPFSRTKSGRVQLTVTKDRTGLMTRGDKIDIMVAVSENRVRFHSPSYDPVAEREEQAAHASSQVRINDVTILAVMGDKPMTVMEIARALRPGDGAAADKARSQVQRRLGEMEKAGRVTSAPGPGKAKVWTKN